MTILEQHAQHTRGPPRASRTVDHAAPPLPASPHFTGHAAGWHGEDQPYTTDPMEQQRCRPASPSREDEGDEFFLFPTRMPRSAIRYQMNTQHPPTRQVMAQTPRTATVYRTRGRTQTAEDQPSPAHPPLRRPRVHWLVYLGLSLLIMLIGWVSLSLFFQWWQVEQDDWHYGRPRTSQVDAVVGHADSPTSPSHFLALNLSRHTEVIEFPGGDATHARVYLGPTLIGEGEDLAVVTLRFKDVNGDGKPDMIVSVQDSTIIFLNENGQFRPARPGEHVNL
jgi:hypothetical protein